LWYELWSKAGATPNLIVEDRLNYIKNLHWVPNWIENYFFNKVSDYILSLLLIALIVFFTFKKKIWIKKNRTFFFIYLFIIFCLLEWFFNHPSLRYGGYHLFALLLFIPLSFKLEEFEINWQSFYKKSLILIFITITIFITRNIIRLNKELKLYDYNISNNLNYLFIGGDKEFYFRYDKYFREKNFRYYNYKLLGKKFLIIKN
jgi:hypothetical protein